MLELNYCTIITDSKCAKLLILVKLIDIEWLWRMKPVRDRLIKLSNSIRNSNWKHIFIFFNVFSIYSNLHSLWTKRWIQHEFTCDNTFLLESTQYNDARKMHKASLQWTILSFHCMKGEWKKETTQNTMTKGENCGKNHLKYFSIEVDTHTYARTILWGIEKFVQ